jgi:RHS repeat-associated protein
MSVPIATSSGRSGFGPQLSVTYDSGSGNGLLGFGWELSLPSIARKTDRGLPQYRDADESDVFMLAGTEDLVPMLDAAGQRILDTASVPGYTLERYLPRIEGGFARIDRWTRHSDRDVHWRTISSDNVLSIYGKTVESRVADPADARRVFSWLLCETRDDRGQAIVYEYKPEDAAGVDVTAPHEQHRGGETSVTRKVNRYIKHIRYGNRVSLLDAAGRRPVDVAPLALQNAGWMFEVVFDYGEHSVSDPKPGDSGAWLCRNDPFSTFRPSFEVRTYRLCQRVLMFHHFPARPGILQDCLVRSTDFAYRDIRGVAEDRRRGHPVASFIASVTQTGYMRAAAGGYTRKSLPPVAFEYSQAAISSEVQELEPGRVQNLPGGIDGVNYRWVDLDGEGLPGVLSEQADAWYYKRNLGQGRLGPSELVAPLPSLANLRSGRQHLVDLDGNGRIDLVQFDTDSPGFYERNDEAGWDEFVTFGAVPNVDWSDPNLQLIDLTGDGLADVLVTEDEVFTWYPSLAEEGFGPGERQRLPLDDERGARLVLADGTQTIFLADMSGDGLTDLIRIRNGSTCYWPNLGYGRFGAKVTMRDAPWFDRPDQFDPRRIRLADIDGSGVADIIYVGGREIRLWFNEAGNGWSAPQRLPDVPHLDSSAAVEVADLLGNGTACLVWSSPLPADAHRPVRYIDLMGGLKPHLLITSVNNLGAETRITYVASTKFYLADRDAGRPWITRLPFPVHVAERVEHVDRVSRSRAMSRYTYHHGYFDGVEREFRGFGLVEQQDTEAFEDYVAGVMHIDGTQDLTPELYQPAVSTRTWFHTGAYVGADHVLHLFRDEYYLKQQHTPDPVLPPGMDADEYRECARALKGVALRQEVYSFDGTSQAPHPYRVIEHNYDVTRVQPRAGQRHGVFFVYGCETLTYDYDRDPADPRIAHSFTLEMDPYGNIRKAASVVHGRTTADGALPAPVTADQQRRYVTYAEFDYTPDIDVLVPVPAYRLRVPYESRGYEVTGVVPAASLFTRTNLRDQIAAATPLAYELNANDSSGQKRPLSRSCTLFRDNALAVRPLGQWDTLGLTFESYGLALTVAVVDAYYGGKLTAADLTAAGYVHFSGDADWWIPSGREQYPANPEAHFFIPSGVRDALGLETLVTLDADDLLPERVRIVQASWNEMLATNDYRVLGPVMRTDSNQNRTAVEVDELGLVVKSAVMGKAGAGEGDTLADPTVRMEYDLFNWMNNRQPNFAHIFSREQHGPANTRWQESYVYSNGSGGVAMVKLRVHVGKARKRLSDGSVMEVDADPRWIANGRTILNNKGNPVKQYEPFFSTTREYETEEALQKIGVTPILYYDPIGRHVRTEFPNGTVSRVAFDSWKQQIFDVNDTVLESPWWVERGSPDPVLHPEPLNNPERRAAWLTARHASTPATLHFDSVGRCVYAVADYGAGKRAGTRTRTDLTGRFTTVFDALEREVSSGFVAMAGPILASSAEKGRRWIFRDVLGALVALWDEHGREARTDYDALHRPISEFAREAGGPELLVQHIVYGDQHPTGAALRLLGAMHLLFDQAGMVRIPEADFKGNPKRAERILARDYQHTLDWTAVAHQTFSNIELTAKLQLEASEVFATAAEYDALNRPTRVTLADGTVLLPAYNRAGFLSTLQAQIRGQGGFTDFLKDQDYDAKGQRQFAQHGNDVVTRYFRDPKTFRLTSFVTHPLGANPDTQAVQHVTYTYDPSGNITQMRDRAQQTRYFNNAAVDAESLYEYDAIYQLVHATGRELAGAINNASRTGSDFDVFPQLPHPNDAQALRTYTEDYDYDILGNIKTLRHRYKPQPGAGSGWTRFYHYAYEDNAADRTNRLTTTSMPGDPDAGPYTGTLQHDAYGNVVQMPHVPVLVWNTWDQLKQVALGGGGDAYYVYGAQGQRVRKVIDRSTTLRLDWIFLGAVMIFRRRRRDTNTVVFERSTVHISDNTGVIAQVDTKTRDTDNLDSANALNTPLVRYQHGNHLGSGLIETDADGEVLSAEEYHPFGTSAYRLAVPGFDLSLRRYRFTGQERDDETGFDYMGARYYAPWLGRWTSTDPGGFLDGANLFRYCRNNPVSLKDPTGLTPPDRLKVEISQPQFTGLENPTVEDFKRYASRMGTPLDPRVNAGNSRIYYNPAYRTDLESHSMEQVPGGTWVLEAVLPPRARRRPASPPPPPPAPPPTPPPEPPAPTPDARPDTPQGEQSDPTTGTVGGTSSQAGPAAEKYIWNERFSGEGLPGTQRGRILEWLYGVPWRSNTKGYDVETPTEVKQIKSTKSYGKVAGTARGATRDAGAAINANPSTMGSKSPRAVVITPTDAPPGVGPDIKAALAGARKPVPNALAPEHVRGLPGKVGLAGKIGLGVGFAFSAYGLVGDVGRGDVPMGIGDALGVVGGGLEILAIAVPGAAAFGVTAMTAGLVIGGLGLAVVSAVGGYRAYEAGDTAGTIAGGAGVAAGLAIAGGAIMIVAGIAAGPVILAVGIVAAVGVGIFHAGRYFGWWD